MDIGQMASSAVTRVTSHCRRVGGHVVDAAAERVYGIIERHFMGNAVGEAVLESLRERPDDEEQISALDALLRKALAEDEALAEELQSSLRGGTQAASPSMVAEKNNITVGSMNRSQVANNMFVDKSRRIKIGVAGLVALIAALLVLVKGSSNDGGDLSEDVPGQGGAGVPVEGSGGAVSSAELAVDEITAPGTIALLRCDETTEMITLAISAVSVDDGRHRGTRQINVPGMDTIDSGFCGVQSRDRFNEDFSQMAVLLRESNGDGVRAAAVDIATGEVIGSSPDPDEFESSPSDSSPTFDRDTGELWYIDDNTQRIMSRPVEASASEAVDRGSGDVNDLLIVVNGTPWLFDFSTRPGFAVNPSGTHAAISDDVHGTLLREPADDVRVAFPGQADYTVGVGSEMGGQELPDGCQPVFWIDDHRLVCSGERYDDETDLTESTYFQVSISEDYTNVTDVHALLPATDQDLGPAVLSPDGSAFAFVSAQGNEIGLYRQSLTSTSEPTKIMDLASGDILLAWS